MVQPVYMFKPAQTEKDILQKKKEIQKENQETNDNIEEEARFYLVLDGTK